MNDILFHNGALLLPENKVSKNGWLVVRDKVIADFGEGEPPDSAAATRVDLERGLLMPGLINTHTHAAMTLFRGLADDLPLMTWLTEYIFPAEKNLTAEWVKWGTRLACAEMIRSGTTAFADMYLFIDAAAQATAECGLRAVMAEALYDFPSPNYGVVANGLRYVEKFIEQWRGHPLITPIVCAHAVYTCSPDLLKAINQLAEKYQTLLHIHLAENQTEVAQCIEHYGARPLQHLVNCGLAHSQILAAHAVYFDDSELDLAAEKQIKITHNPVSNLKLTSGIAPVAAMLNRGITVGLGTDGCASNNNLDMFNTLKTTAILHKWAVRDATAVSAEQALAMATNAAVIGLEKVCGKIERGLAADLIVIDFAAPNLQPCYNYWSQLVYAATPANVRDTMVDGKFLMRNRQLMTIDEMETFEQTSRLAGQIRELVSRHIS